MEQISSLPQMKGADFPPPWPEIMSRASRIIGYPRHLSVHCGGVVITSGEISERVPVEKAPKGVPIIQWEKDAAEDFGLVKLDILGNRSLAVIRDAIANMRSNGITFDEDRWDPENDAATIDLVARGDTMGVFYVESPAMRQLQKKTEKGDFEHLVIHSSIIRPAANAYISEYVRRLRGGAWKPLHPLLEDTLSETFGIMCYQEDVSRAAVAIAGFTPAEGDTLRKVLSKKDRARRLPDFKAKFMAGAAKNGVAAETALKIWSMMESFAGYSFCKPHSASYAKVSFQSAYLKAHHPAEFMAAVLSNRGGYYTAFAYVSEAARMGLRVLPPDVNASEGKFTGRGRDLRTGLMQVRGLSDDEISAIPAVRRERGPFASLEDFLRRVKIDRPGMESLILCGAFDSIRGVLTRPQMLWKLWSGGGVRQRPAGMSSGTAMLADPDADTHLKMTRSAPRLAEYTQERLRGLEMELLGYMCSCHPLTHWLALRPGLKFTPGSELAANKGRRVRTVGWLVTAKLVYTKHGDPMEFVSFEDTGAIYEAVFFPGAFRKFAHMLDGSRPYMLSGKVEEDYGAVSLSVEDAGFL